MRGLGPLDNTVTAVPPPSSLRPLAPAGRAPPLRPPAPTGLAPPRDPVPPRSVRVERKARPDKLQSLLYPHPDKMADFKSSVGEDLQPHRLFSDVKFRDTWMQFRAASREAAKDGNESLHKKWYEKFSNTTKSKSNYLLSTRSTKRKDHSFDTGNAPTSAAQPEYKILRKGKSPATPQVAAGITTPPAVPTLRRARRLRSLCFRRRRSSRSRWAAACRLPTLLA